MVARRDKKTPRFPAGRFFAAAGGLANMDRKYQLEATRRRRRVDHRRRRRDVNGAAPIALAPVPITAITRIPIAVVALVVSLIAAVPPIIVVRTRRSGDAPDNARQHQGQGDPAGRGAEFS